MRVVLAVLALASCSAALTSCSAGDGVPGSASGSVSGSSPIPASAPADPIPPVRNPRNLTAIQPCLLVTSAQLDTNGIDQPGQPKDVLGLTGCEWSDSAHTRQFAAFADLGNDVLRNVYNQRNEIPVLEVTKVGGLPAIRTKDDVDGASCYFRVATAEMQTLIVRFTSLRPGRADPCAPAKAFTETIVSNLPPLDG
ncbi:MAG: DUF3558 domain-containing protein [Pseudonocardiaceae bacterium]